ncbi:far upstream element-binding protein 1 [Hordeum vulgare]|nr:far upstream element-binding protein 1 [Hordeum vulgare]
MAERRQSPEVGPYVEAAALPAVHPRGLRLRAPSVVLRQWPSLAKPVKSCAGVAPGVHIQEHIIQVGVIIGKAGETIKHIQLQSGAKIQVTRDMDFQPWSQTRLVDLSGTPDHISRAEQLISDVLAEAHAGSFGTIPNWKYNAPQPSVEQFQMQIANNKVIPFHFPPGDTSTERTLYIDGTTEQIEIAKQLGYE